MADLNTGVTLGPSPVTTPSGDDEAVARRLYEEELVLVSKLEADERVARELQAKEDRSVAKRLTIDDEEDESEGAHPRGLCWWYCDQQTHRASKGTDSCS